MKPYEEIAQAIINKLIEVLGKKLALARALRVDGLYMNPDGQVNKISGKGEEVLEKLVWEFEDLLGPAGIAFCRGAAEPILKKNTDITIPKLL